MFDPVRHSVATRFLQLLDSSCGLWLLDVLSIGQGLLWVRAVAVLPVALLWLLSIG